MFFLRVAVITLFLTLAITSGPASASTYVDVEDDIYTIFTRLEAEGTIRSGLLSTKPISRKEALRLLQEAETNSEGKNKLVRTLVRALRERLGPDERDKPAIDPIDTVYGKYVHSNTDLQHLNYNNNGDQYDRGPNYRAGLTSRIEDFGPVSLYLNPEFRHPDGADREENNVIARKAYGVLDFGWDLVIGKDSQWWGPGHHGALLLTNNAEPFTMVKIANPTPVTLPWIFKHLGPFGFTFFVTNLEKARDIPEPYLYGLRLSFKPHPNVEAGIEKTAILGGRKGRPEDARTWIDSLLPFSDTENRAGDPGDQRAGFDVKWTVPWNVQPMQIYLEAAGEDEYHNLPNLWAFVGGVYLPRVLGAERLDFRMEYATTRGRKKTPYIWYVHGLYETYTYKDNIIGHHIGTDADDIFMEVSYLAPEINGRIFVFYDREEQNLYVSGNHETKEEIATGLKTSLTTNIDVTLQAGYGWVVNPGNTSGKTIHEDLMVGQVQYRF